MSEKYWWAGHVGFYRSVKDFSFSLRNWGNHWNMLSRGPDVTYNFKRSLCCDKSKGVCQRAVRRLWYEARNDTRLNQGNSRGGEK